jgi:CSLREA domain-containing protein
LRSDDSILWGNYVGVNAEGLVPVDVPASRWCKPNARYYNWFGGAGVDVSGKRCQIGGADPEQGNVIAAMLIYGDSPFATPPVALNLNRQEHLVQNNIIGMDLSGQAVGTCGDGIIIDAPHTRVISNTVARSAAISLYSSGTRYNSNARTMQGNVILDTTYNPEYETLFDFGPGIPEELAVFTPTQVITFEADGLTVHGLNAPGAPCPYCRVELFADDLDGISETLESLAVTTTDVDGNWTATLSRPLLNTEGLRTAVTALNYGTIPNYDAGTTSRFSTIYRPPGATDITPPTPVVEEPLPIPEISYTPPPTLPYNLTYNTVITVTTAGDPREGNDWDDEVCYDEYDLNFYEPVAPCSLRRAVQEAGALAQSKPEALPILIKFDIPTSDGYSSDYGGYWTIALSDTGDLDALPELGSQTVLDGDTQPGGRTDGPKIVVRGPENVPNGYGLRLYGDDNLVRGLAFQRLRMHMFVGGSGNVIEDNWFGLSDDGLDLVLRDPEHPEDGTGQSGIIVAENEAHNLIQDNVLAGFRGGAISLGSNDSYVRGNYVGVNAQGVIPVDITYNRLCMPNARYYNWFGGAGVDVYGHRNVIGGPDEADGNILASMLIRGQDPLATPPDALAIYGGDHLVQNNLIGVDALGQDAGVCGVGLRLKADYTRYISNTISQSGIYALYQAGTRYDSNSRTLQGNVVWDSDTLLEFDPGIPEDFQNFSPAHVTDITVGAGDTSVSGVNGADSPCPYCQVEVFTDDLDETPELLESLAVVTADANGDWSANLGRELTLDEGLRTVVTAQDYGVIEEYYEAGSTSRYSELYAQPGSTPPDPEPDPAPVPARAAPPITYTAPPVAPTSYALVVTVTTTADTSGSTCGETCSLRQAIGHVSGYGQPRPALIVFDIPTSDDNYDSALGVYKITLGSTLPTLEDGQVTLDATTQSGYDGSRPVVIVLRDSPTSIKLKLGTTALDDNNVVRGLALQGVGLMLNGDGNIVSHNWLGLSDDGDDIYYYGDNPNYPNGAIIQGAGGSGGHYIHHNVLAGSGTVAVDLEGNDNLIANNWVGTRGDGTLDVASIPTANICDQTVTTDNWLGGGGIDLAGYRNRIISNTIAGLLVKGSANSTPPAAIDLGYGEYNLVQDNRIGLDVNGDEVWTCGDGVSDVGSDFTQILSNTIVNSFGHGMYVDGDYWDSNANTLQGNVISNCIGAITFGDTVPDELDLFSPALVTLIEGTSVTGISDDDCPYCYVDVYLDDDDPWTEALEYWGTTTADAQGDWTFVLPRELTANEGLRTISTARNYGVIDKYEIGSSSNATPRP